MASSDDISKPTGSSICTGVPRHSVSNKELCDSCYKTYNDLHKPPVKGKVFNNYCSAHYCRSVDACPKCKYIVSCGIIVLTVIS